MSPSNRPAVTAWTLAFLLASVSIGGLCTSAYARESAAWQAQAVGQDWFDLLVAAPWLAICAVGARTRSHRWRILLAGGYAYTAYEMIIYTFAIHFNALFLAYCATLSIAGFALVGTALELSRGAVDVEPRTARGTAAFLLALGLTFGLMWLAEDVPAVVRNTPPPSLVANGLFTNPVHVIDLAFVLPLHVLSGLWLWQRHRSGRLLAGVVLGFDVLMSASIGGMMILMHATGAGAPVQVTVAMFAVSGIAVVALSRLLRSPRPEQELRSRAAS